MTTHQTTLATLLDVIQQANAVARADNLTTLLEQMLDLVLHLSDAHAAYFYAYDPASGTCQPTTTRSAHGGSAPRPAHAATLCAELLQDGHATTAEHTPRLLQHGNTAAYALVDHDRPLGVVLLTLPSPYTTLHHIHDAAADCDLDLVQIVLERLTPDIGRSLRIEAEMQRAAAQAQLNTRLKELVSFITSISATLERNKLIKTIMDYAERLLQVEATSFWLLDKNGERLELLIAGGDNQGVDMPRVSIPADTGIIGHVVTHSQCREIVNDVHRSPYFHANVDDESGFVTRSILCVPMHAPSIQRAAQQGGEIRERVIGGAQALNKRDGSDFTDEDAQLFETLTRQAAIAFQFSQLFEEQEKLFWGIVRAVSTAADLKDPSFSPGHSHRVALLSVEIARELGCTDEVIAHVRIGSRLHDLGKVGVSDIILGKKDRLNEAEMDEIRKHPQIGYDLLVQAGLSDLLEEELRAVIEHHERLDGNGYPHGLQGDQISLIGRIVSVADVFDALTNDRPYRKALTLEETLAVLHDMIGVALDPECVAALERACQQGRIRVPMPLPEEIDDYAVTARAP